MSVPETPDQRIDNPHQMGEREQHFGARRDMPRCVLKINAYDINSIANLYQLGILLLLCTGELPNASA